MTCHNRKEKTLQCLRKLYCQKGLYISYFIDVFLVDDGSSDQTSSAILKDFPNVNIIIGTGELYWNRGMHLAWKTAIATKDYNYYLWLNDDTFLFENALQTLFRKVLYDHIVVGTTISKSRASITYGVFLKNPLRFIIPDGNFQEGDLFNGNCVLISKSVLNRLGNLDPIFHHALGDFDYGLRARKKGIKIYAAPEIIGTCEWHETLPLWCNQKIGFIRRIKNLYSPKSGCHPFEHFIFDLRHKNILRAFSNFITIHIKCVFPFFLKLKSAKF